MQKLILDTIEELNKEFGEYCPIAHKTVVSKKLESFLKQALTNAFEAGQKSREKEIVETKNKWFERGYKESKLVEKMKEKMKTDPHFLENSLKKVIKSLSLTKELK